MTAPDRMHHTSNFRDLSRVVKVILLLSEDRYQEFPVLQPRLDARNVPCLPRLPDRRKDQGPFQLIINAVADATLPAEFLPNNSFEALIFGDYVKALDERSEERQYKETSAPNAMNAARYQLLEDYNSIYTKNPLHLVLFEDAIKHIARLARILKIPGGHAVLVGVGGSGKMSTAKFATFVSGCQSFSIEATRNCGKRNSR